MTFLVGRSMGQRCKGSGWNPSLVSLQAGPSKALRQETVGSYSQTAFRITAPKSRGWDIPFQRKTGWKTLEPSSPMKSMPFQRPEQDCQPGTFFRVCTGLKPIARWPLLDLSAGICAASAWVWPTLRLQGWGQSLTSSSLLSWTGWLSAEFSVSEGKALPRPTMPASLPPPVIPQLRSHVTAAERKQWAGPKA